MNKKLNYSHLLLVLGLAVFVGLVLKGAFKGDWFEFAAFVTGVLSVYLVAVEHIWNWPIGLVNVSIFGYVFFKGNLLADMSLQLFFFVLGVQGWYHWLKGGQDKTQLKISRIPPIWWGAILVLLLVGTAIYYPIVTHYKGASPLVDSMLTVGSIIAQILLNMKRIENWIIWILVDIAYIPLYLSRNLGSAAVLYGIFLALAIGGLIRWTKALKAAEA
jgi:nicotinamide mononucleotide transporter